MLYDVICSCQRCQRWLWRYLRQM